MKKRLTIIKEQVGEESKKTLMVLLGFTSGALLSKGMDMLSEKFPTAEPFVKYAKPLVFSGGGILISSATTKDELMKYFGYGVSAVGVYNGIKLVPFAKDFFGMGGVEPDVATTYYTESNLNAIEAGNFGINALPVKSFSVEETPRFKVELPELQTSSSPSGNTDLGYNEGATDDVDFRGIL